MKKVIRNQDKGMNLSLNKGGNQQNNRNLRAGSSKNFDHPLPPSLLE